MKIFASLNANQTTITCLFFSSLLFQAKEVDGVKEPTQESDVTSRPTVVRNYSPIRYGTKPGHFETSKIHFPTSEGVSEVNERASE